MSQTLLAALALALFPFLGQAANAPPTIGAIASGTVFVDHPALVVLNVADAETATTNLQLSLASSNPTLIPAANVVFHYFSIDGNWYITVAPAFGLTGTVTNTVTVSDGTNSASASFELEVAPPPPGAARFANTNAMTIPTMGGASAYPSTINVSGMLGAITNLTLSVSKFSHQYIHDVSMLLVGPAGQGVVIFSHVSGTVTQGASATNVNFTLTDASPYVLPEFYELWSEQFRPTDWATNDFFPAPAPPATNGHYGPVAFSTFQGQPANGTWSLFVYDEEAPDGGSIAGGWSLMISTDSLRPTISDILNQTTITNTPTAAIPFTVSDAETPAASLTLSGGSSNPTLVPTNNIVFGGSGSNRTVTITPANGQGGTAMITVTVSDGTNTDSDSFLLAVSVMNTPPTIVPIAPQATLVNRAVGPFNISIGDAETPAGGLALSGTSSDTNLVPDANIVLYNNPGMQTLAVSPAAGQVGEAMITIGVSDGVFTTNTSFKLTVNPPGPETTIFDNPSIITITDNTSASPYPSTLSVGGIVGTITNLTITLHNMSHQYPGDVGMLLIGPTGQKVVIFSAVVGNQPMTNVTFTLSDDAQFPLPAAGHALPPGTYRPTDLAPNHTSPPYIFPAPAPAAPYATNLSAFNGASPNGNWSLYVADNSPGAAGTLSGGWSLTFATQSTRPILARPTRTSTNATLSWSAIAGVSYRVQYKADWNSTTWGDLAGDVTAAGTNATKVDASVSGTTRRFYRIRVLP